MDRAKKHFILLSESAGILVQVLNAVHATGPSHCIVIVPEKTRRIALTNMTAKSIYADFNGRDDAYLLAEINRLSNDRPDLVIIPCDCPAARVVNRIGQQLNAFLIPAPDPAMLDCFDDKWAFYQFCRKNGINVPPSGQIASKHDLDFAAAASEFGLPFVIKPLNEAGSKGVQVISSEQEFQRTILHDDSYQFSPLLVQQYIRGIDIGLNLLAIHGRISAISIQQRDFPQNFSAPIRFIHNDELESAARKIGEISRYHGVMNIDARIDEQTGRVFLFESNPRFWGSLTASVWYGLNFVQECLDPAPPGQVRRLHSGWTSVHYHPVVQPALWWQVLFSRHAHRRRMLRRMTFDVWTFLVQFGSLRQKLQKHVGTWMRDFQLWS